MTHTTARQAACETGARGATLPGITPEVWNGALTANYGTVKQISNNLFDIIRGARRTVRFDRYSRERVTVETPSGTNLSLKIDSEHFEIDTGIYHKNGEFGNLPAGEVDGPVISAEGVVVIDHCLQAPKGAIIEIEDGRALSIDTESELADAFESVLGARQVAELGIGTNPQATLIGNILQDEKSMGTCHVAFGDNTSYVPSDHKISNSSPVYYDIILKSPTVTIDGTVVLKKGETQFPTN